MDAIHDCRCELDLVYKQLDSLEFNAHIVDGLFNETLAELDALKVEAAQLRIDNDRLMRVNLGYWSAGVAKPSIIAP